ncbi:MAG TPA: patatin-like phospholipase family protein [Usitatibacter sp.]|jgi:NTE family protein|nr:patatin-like phospholipase family protein [Usitatibacter sp.]
MPFRIAAALVVACAAAGAWGAERPRIGLVLGGGGARGGAHLGVLEVLEELRVPVDCIAGTSMGGLAAGAYAAGVSPPEIEELVGDTDWIAIFNDTAGRRAENMRQKEFDDRYYSGLELGVSRKGVRFREGALAGEKLKLFFNRLVRSELGDRAIEDLALPISIIATDIGDGERVPMRSGNLTSAMRASMSVPGLMSPVLRENRKLVDGGLTDNLPIAEVKDLCKPDVVIAVNVGSPLFRPEQVTGVVTVLGQVVNLLTEQNVAKSRQLLGPRDIYIQPDLENISSTDFTRQLDAAKRGRVAALAASDELRRYSMPMAQYAQWQERLRLAAEHLPPVIDKVEIAATRFVNGQSVRSAITQPEGKPLDSQKLAQDLVSEYSQGDLHSLDYGVVRERDKTVLRITPVEKPWGPDYLRFGMGLATDFRAESLYNLRALYRRTWLNPLDGEWQLGGQIGSLQDVVTEFYQPLDGRQLTFVQATASAALHKTPLFVNGDRVAVYRIQENRAGAEAGMNIGAIGQARVGWVERHLGSVLDTGPSGFLNSSERVSGPEAALSIDTYDQAFFPTRGFKLDVTHFDAQRVWASDPTLGPYSRSEARVGAAVSHNRFTFLGELDGGTAFKGTLPLADAFTLGGPRRMSGFAVDQMLGGDYTFGRLEAQYRLNWASPLWGLTLIAGLSAEAGRMNKLLTDQSLAGWQHSYGGYLAANTFLGPVYFGIADAKNGKGRLYLFIGTP